MGGGEKDLGMKSGKWILRMIVLLETWQQRSESFFPISEWKEQSEPAIKQIIVINNRIRWKRRDQRMEWLTNLIEGMHSTGHLLHSTWVEQHSCLHWREVRIQIVRSITRPLPFIWYSMVALFRRLQSYHHIRTDLIPRKKTSHHRLSTKRYRYCLYLLFRQMQWREDT